MESLTDAKATFAQRAAPRDGQGSSPTFEVTEARGDAASAAEIESRGSPTRPTAHHPTAETETTHDTPAAPPRGSPRQPASPRTASRPRGRAGR